MGCSGSNSIKEIRTKIGMLLLKRNKIRDERDFLMKKYEKITHQKFYRFPLPYELNIDGNFLRKGIYSSNLDNNLRAEKNSLLFKERRIKFHTYLTSQRIPKAFTIKAARKNKHQQNDVDSSYSNSISIEIKDNKNKEYLSNKNRRRNRKTLTKEEQSEAYSQEDKDDEFYMQNKRLSNHKIYRKKVLKNGKNSYYRIFMMNDKGDDYFSESSSSVREDFRKKHLENKGRIKNEEGGSWFSNEDKSEENGKINGINKNNEIVNNNSDKEENFLKMMNLNY